MRTSLVALLMVWASAGHAAQQTEDGFLWPPPYGWWQGFTHNLGASGQFDAKLLDASGEQLAFIVRVPKTCTLETVGFMTATTTTGDDLKVSFQDVSATDGHPDGTADQYRVITIADGDDDVWKKTGIISSDGSDTGTKRSVTKGDLIAIVIEFNSYVAGNLNINVLDGLGNGSSLQGQLYYDYNSGAGYTKGRDAHPHFSLECDDGSYAYIPDTIPYTTLTATDFNNGTTPDERALKFQVPFPATACGAWVVLRQADGGNVDVVLYEGTTAQKTTSIDEDQTPAPDTYNNFYVPFATTQALTASTNYYMSVKPTTATNVRVPVLTSDEAVLLDQLAGGQTMMLSTRTDAGAWSDTTTDRPLIGVHLCGFDDAAGGGGGSYGVIGGTMLDPRVLVGIMIGACVPWVIGRWAKR